MLGLSGYGRNVFLVCRSLILGRWTRVDPARASVVADPVHRSTVDHCGVVNVVNTGDAHIIHGAVVVELSALPTSTLIALTKVPIAVTDPAIKTYLRTPVAVIENITVAAPTPVSRSPEQTDFGSHDPRSRHPVVVVEVAAVSPVPGRPQITIAGT